VTKIKLTLPMLNELKNVMVEQGAGATIVIEETNINGVIACEVPGVPKPFLLGPNGSTFELVERNG
jgi:hypothetical protein